MNLENVKKLDKRIALFFCFFLVVLIVQHRFVYFYYDDYGYVSLTFGGYKNVSGMDYTLRDIINFLKWHYNAWGGRILYYFVMVVSMHIGLGFIRVLQAAFIWLITILSYLLLRTADRNKNLFISVMLIVLYGTIGIPAFRHGIYWFSASSSYVWSLLPFFGALLLYREVSRGKEKYILPAILCFFFAAFSQEQIAVMVSLYIVSVTLVRKYHEKSYLKGSVGMIISAFLGSALVILAPGNFKRAEMNAGFRALSFREKIAINLPELLRLNVGLCNVVKVVVLILAMGCAMLVLDRKRKDQANKSMIKLVGIIIVSIGLMLTWVIHLPNAWKCVLQLIFVVSLCLIFSRYMIKEKYIWLIILFYAGICTQLVMLLLPDIFDRCHIMLDFIISIVVVQIFADYLSGLRGLAFKWKWLPIAVTIFLSICNMTVLTYGYFSNVKAQDYNHTMLSKASEEIASGVEVNSIVLHQLKYDYFAIFMPYQTPGLEDTVKYCYSLPETVDFIWEK